MIPAGFEAFNYHTLEGKDVTAELLVELADISPEVVQMAITPENGETLPGWFVVEAVRDIPALAKRRNGT